MNKNNKTKNKNRSRVDTDSFEYILENQCIMLLTSTIYRICGPDDFSFNDRDYSRNLFNLGNLKTKIKHYMELFFSEIKKTTIHEPNFESQEME